MKVIYIAILSFITFNTIFGKSLKYIEQNDEYYGDDDSYNLLDQFPECFKIFYSFGIKGFNQTSCNGLEFLFNAAYNLDKCFLNGTKDFVPFSLSIYSACNGILSNNYCTLPSYVFNGTYTTQEFVSETCAPWKNDGKYLPPCVETCKDGSIPVFDKKYPNCLGFMKLTDFVPFIKKNKSLIFLEKNSNTWSILVKYSKTKVNTRSNFYSLTYLNIDNSVQEGYTLSSYKYDENSFIQSAYILQ